MTCKRSPSTSCGRRGSFGPAAVAALVRTSIAVVSVCSVSTIGCGPGEPAGPETSPVTGTVTLDGTPVAGAKVLFRPVQSGTQGKTAEAVTGEDGRYEMRTHVGQGQYKTGMVPGEYYVTLNKLDTAAVATTMMPPRNLLPVRYNNARTSGLTATVAAGQDNEVPLQLSSK